MKATTIHAQLRDWEGRTRAACGKKVSSEAIAEDALAVTCGAQACQNERARILRALVDATTESRTYEMRARWDEPSETIGLLTYPLESYALVNVPGLGVSLTILDEASAERYCKLADALERACRDALTTIRARTAHPDAAERLAALAAQGEAVQ